MKALGKQRGTGKSKVHPRIGYEDAKGSLTSALDRGGCSTPRPGKKTRYPQYRRLGEPQGQSGRVRKISHPLGFDPRTFQPVASRYTDYVTNCVVHYVRTFPLCSQNPTS
jgi:hypothetical protein